MSKSGDDGDDSDDESKAPGGLELEVIPVANTMVGWHSGESDSPHMDEENTRGAEADRRAIGANTFMEHGGAAQAAQELRRADKDSLSGRRVKLEDGRIARVTGTNKRLGKSTTHQLLFESDGRSEAVLLRKAGRNGGDGSTAFRLLEGGASL